MDYVCKSPFHLFIVYLPCVQHDPFTPAFPGPGTGHGRVGNALVDVLKNVSLLSEPMVHPHHPAWAFLNIALGKLLEIHPLEVLSATLGIHLASSTQRPAV